MVLQGRTRTIVRAAGAAIAAIALWRVCFVLLARHWDKPQTLALVAGFLVLCAAGLAHGAYTLFWKR